MSKSVTIFLVLSHIVFVQVANSTLSEKIKSESIPSMMVGKFTDDYGMRYEINDTLWTQHPNIKYHIISWNNEEQFLLAYNDDQNAAEPGLFTRIDYMSFNNMEPFNWGFCLTTYDANNIEEARNRAKADRENPKIGCNGYPFSRMKLTD